MIKGYQSQRLNKELKELSQRFSTAYDIAVKNSEAAYKSALPSGAVFHARNGFYRDEDKAAFDSKCQSFRQQAHELLDDVTKKLTDEATAAPSQDAFATIQLLQMRKDVSADELDSLMTKYGDNPLAYKSLKEIAEGHGYYDFVDHPLGAQAEAVQILSNSIDRTFSTNNSSVVGAVAGWDANTDQAFPSEA